MAISAFGSHQPLLICTHVSHEADSKGTNNTQNMVGRGIGKERAGIMGQDSMILHLNQRLKEVTKTLNRTTRPASQGTEIRRK